MDCWNRNPDRPACDPPEGDFESINSGTYEFCATQRSGNVKCWGAKRSGGEMTFASAFDLVLGNEMGCVIEQEGDVPTC